MHLILRRGGEERGVSVCPGEALRFGRVSFVVLEKRLGGTLTSISDNYFRASVEDGASAHSECRFCFSPQGATLEETLISPCRCKGSTQFIHLRCLRAWLLANVLHSSSEKIDSFYFQRLECEICRAPYPLRIDVEGRKVDLLECARPRSDYLMLELKSSEDSARTQAVIVIRPQGPADVFRIGRGGKNDINLQDTYVSREHAVLEYF